MFLYYIWIIHANDYKMAANWLNDPFSILHMILPKYKNIKKVTDL